MYFSYANAFFPTFHRYEKICRHLCSVSHVKPCYLLFKTCQTEIRILSQTFKSQEILKRKINNLYDITALRNDLENKTNKFVNLILTNAMPKVMIEVYVEVLVTNFYAQISCSRHSKCVKIIPTLSHRIARALSASALPTSAKMF